MKQPYKQFSFYGDFQVEDLQEFNFPIAFNGADADGNKKQVCLLLGSSYCREFVLHLINVLGFVYNQNEIGEEIMCD